MSKTNNKCGDCRNYMSCESATCVSDTACDGFKSDERTLFDRITESEEVLAEKLVYSYSIVINRNRHGNGILTLYSTRYTSNVIGGSAFETKEEAITATIEKLKEACDE